MAVFAVLFASAHAFHAMGAIDHGHGTEAAASTDDEGPKVVPRSAVPVRTDDELGLTERPSDDRPPQPRATGPVTQVSDSPPWSPPPRRGPPSR